MLAEPVTRSGFLFVGLGSSHGDDAVGWKVADALLKISPEGLVIRKALAPIDLLDWLEPGTRLLTCDGCQGLETGETWRRWAWPDCNVAWKSAVGVHDFTLPGVLALAEKLGRLSFAPEVWGIEVGACEPATELNGDLATTVDTVVDDVLAFVSSSCKDSACTKPRSFVRC
ncbi:MAG: hypothetical protein NT069_12055 [Planctomycetota bacterium]|nr:hypothetical protein [Planctomycetota bacterium]